MNFPNSEHGVIGALIVLVIDTAAKVKVENVKTTLYKKVVSS